jgi:hypothetical protein
MIVAEPPWILLYIFTDLTELDMPFTEHIPTSRTSNAVGRANQIAAVTTPVNVVLTPDCITDITSL